MLGNIGKRKFELTLGKLEFSSHLATLDGARGGGDVNQYAR